MTTWPERHQHRQQLIEAALLAADPAHGLRAALQKDGNLLQIGDATFDLTQYANVYAIGYGKASARMAQVAEEILGDALVGGVVITKHDHRLSLQKIALYEAGHPVPDAASVAATTALLEFVATTTADDLVLVLVSGGGSALLAKPAGDLTLADLQAVTQRLLACGADIHEINAVRKHLSAVKGGQLAAVLAPATTVALVLSDVLGNDLSVIASGPTSPDDATFADAIGVLERYQQWQAIPLAVQAHLTAGANGMIAETPSSGAAAFARVSHHIIGDNGLAIDAVVAAATDLGFATTVVTRMLTGEARDQAKLLLQHAAKVDRPHVLIAGGETTVTLQGNGKGGRNQEMALAAAIVLDDLQLPNCQFICLATDGTDGPTDAAGAFGDSDTVNQHDIAFTDYLANNDAYHCFKQIDGLIMTGPTGTNVNDVVMIVLY